MIEIIINISQTVVCELSYWIMYEEL